MKPVIFYAAVAAAGLFAATPPAAQSKPAPPFAGETLRYAVNWPSGLGIGEAAMEASRSGDRWSFAFSLDASVPGFAASDSYQSLASAGFCSLRLEKQFTHGKRKGAERTTFDPESGTATRETLNGGGKSEFSIGSCPRDALAFLYYLRRELADGRVPAAQDVYFGAVYRVRVSFTGRQTISVNDQPAESDRVLASIKGPASDSSVELFFARDAARTPLMFRVPFKAGTFSLELVR